MVITLIGYRGTGKSTLAIPLAERLGWAAVDADAELERRAGRTIRQIFDTDGESEFRRLERETLVELLSRNRIVIAAGGGAIMNPATREDFQNAGPVIWLKASIDTIERRILGDSTTTARRPNLTSAGGRAEIESLLDMRNPFYEQCATITIETDTVDPAGNSLAKNVDELLESIITQLEPLIDKEIRP